MDNIPNGLEKIIFFKLLKTGDCDGLNMHGEFKIYYYGQCWNRAYNMENTF